MSMLIVWKSDTADGAERAAEMLLGLSGEPRASIHDAALASWARGSSKPVTRPVPGLASSDSLGEPFWGVLFGLTFYSPLLGAAVVSTEDAISGSFAHFGISDTFVHRARDTLTPGTSALFVLGSDDLTRHVCGAIGVPAELVVAPLTTTQELALREVFVG